YVCLDFQWPRGSAKVRMSAKQSRYIARLPSPLHISSSSHFSFIQPLLHPTPPSSNLSFIQPLLHPTSPSSNLFFIPLLLHPIYHQQEHRKPTFLKFEIGIFHQFFISI